MNLSELGITAEVFEEYQKQYKIIKKFIPKEKPFKCKGKHKYQLITNGKWTCTCGKQLNF